MNLTIGHSSYSVSVCDFMISAATTAGHWQSTVFLTCGLCHTPCFVHAQPCLTCSLRDKLSHSEHFKIATLTYRALQSGSPSYLSSLINLNNPPRPLRYASLSLLHVPFTAKAVGRKAFRFAAPTIWNSILQNIRLLPSIGSFKCSLKTHLFSHPG